MKKLILSAFTATAFLIGTLPSSAYYADGHRTHGANYFGTGVDGAVVVSSNTTLTSTTDGGFVIKNYSSLYINSDVTLTVSNRCAGLIIYVQGDCTINGTISMDGLGGAIDSPTEGVNLQYRAASSGLLTDYLLAGTGAAGAPTNTTGTPTNGSSGSSDQTGGGGNGAGAINAAGNGGEGGTGSSFCGGSGGGGGGYNGSSTAGGAGAANGASGGDGGLSSGGTYAADGGSGNPGGSGSGNSFTNPTAGGGGVIYLIVGGNLSITSAGLLTCNGTAGGAYQGNFRSIEQGGAGSGGGRIVYLYAGTLSNTGTIRANGGAGGLPTGSQSYNYGGAAGGAGTVTGAQVLGAFVPQLPATNRQSCYLEWRQIQNVA